MAKNHVPIPKSRDVEEWRRFINAEIPLIEETSNERGLHTLRNRVAHTVAWLEKPNHDALPVNPARYEGNMGAFSQYAFEHFAN